ncbi:DUF2339 domain-containing protein [bacterium]|nr:DUF2339 domain-containing protein [bacterium]
MEEMIVIALIFLFILVPFVLALIGIGSFLDLKRRLGALERRVFNLENGQLPEATPRSVAPGPQPVSVPQSVQATQATPEPQRVPQQPQQIPAQQPKTEPVQQKIAYIKPTAEAPQASVSLESFFLGNIFSKLGALAIFVFVILLIKWASPFLFVNNQMKVAAIYLLSFILSGTGIYLLFKPQMRGFAELILGLGFATAITVTYTGSTYFELWDDFTSVVLSSFILIAIYALAAFLQRNSVLCMGMIAGYSNLIFICSCLSSKTIFGVYILLLSLFCVLGALRCKTWHFWVSFNLFISFLFASIYYSGFREMHIVNFCAIWIVYVLYDLLRSEEGSDPEKKGDIKLTWTIYFNHILLALLGIIIYDTQQINLSLSLLIMAIIMAGLSYVRKASPKLSLAFFSSALIIWSFCIFSWERELIEIIALAFSGTLCLLTSIFNKEEIIPRLNERLKTWCYTFNFAAATVTLFSHKVFIAEIHDPVKLNLGNLALLLFAVPIISWSITYFISKEYANDDKQLNSVSLWSIFTLFYIYLAGELNQLMTYSNNGSDIHYLSLIILFTIYSIQMLFMYRRNQNQFFIVTSVLTMVFVTLSLVGFALSGSGHMLPVLNIGLVAYVLAIIYMVLGYILFQNEFGLTMAILLGWALVHREGVNIVKRSDIESITSIFWAFYSGLIIFTGILGKKRTFTRVGIVIVICTLCRIVFYDMSELSTGYKLLSSFIIGCVLLAVSFIYSKYHAQELPASEDQQVSINLEKTSQVDVNPTPSINPAPVAVSETLEKVSQVPEVSSYPQKESSSNERVDQPSQPADKPIGTWHNQEN